MNESLKLALELDRKTQIAFRRPKPRKIWEWAEACRRIAKSETAKPGRYRTSTAPYQREPQESFTATEVQTTVLYWAKRLGKTVCIENLHGATMDENPRNILHVMPTLETIVKWSKQFLAPLIEGVESLSAKVMKARSRDSGNTIRSKRFPGGTISGIGTNSPSGFRQVQAPVVTCDEVDAMEDGPEGDPVFLAFGRSENYEDSVQVVSSTATRILFKAKDGEQKQDKTTGSRIHDWWLKSDQRKWFARCPDCEQSHVLMWENVKWPKKALEGGSHEHQPELAWYECPKCKSKWDDSKRLKAILDGEWKATAPFKGVRGYWLNGLNTTFPPKKGYKTKLHQMAAEFLDAKRSGESAITVWQNTFLCEPVEIKAEKIDKLPLMERREHYTINSIPVSCVVLALTADVQGDRIEIQITGMGENDETWAIEYRKLIGNPELDSVWDDLSSQCARTFKREDGVELKISYIGVDLGFKPKRVRQWIKKCGLPRVYGIYGTSGKQINLLLPKYSKYWQAWSYSINTNLAKEMIYARLKLPEMGQRYMHFSDDKSGFDSSYFDMLTIEERRLEYVHGFPHWTFHKPDGARNEALDLWVYFLGVIEILPPNIKAINNNLLRTNPQAGQSRDYVLKPHEPKKDAPVANVAQRQAVPRRGRVVGGRGVGLRGAQSHLLELDLETLALGVTKYEQARPIRHDTGIHNDCYAFNGLNRRGMFGQINRLT